MPLHLKRPLNSGRYTLGWHKSLDDGQSQMCGIIRKALLTLLRSPSRGCRRIQVPTFWPAQCRGRPDVSVIWTKTTNKFADAGRYFIHDGYAGLSAFINKADERSDRAARMLAVGILVPLEHGRMGRSWRHAEALKELARYIFKSSMWQTRTERKPDHKSTILPIPLRLKNTGNNTD